MFRHMQEDFSYISSNNLDYSSLKNEIKINLSLNANWKYSETIYLIFNLIRLKIAIYSLYMIVVKKNYLSLW
jgi:hypothetical protein